MVEIAAELRRQAEQFHPPFSTRRIIDACFPKALVTGGQLPDAVDELVTPHPDGPVIVYARRLSGPEQRIAIAHAIAHLIFDDASACMRPGSAGVVASEERADRFAAELLAPIAVLGSLVTRMPSRDPEDHEIYLDHVDEIASTFGCPASVIDSQIRLLVSNDSFVSR